MNTKKLLLAGMFGLLAAAPAMADVDPEGTDPRTENIDALRTVQEGARYQIYTYSDGNTITGTKFYLKANGFLTNDPEQAGIFPLQLVKQTINIATGDINVTAFKFDARFTNPSMIDGDIYPQGHIVIADEQNNRDDFEAQVFFLGRSGNYAIRATAAKSENWGANSYWTATDYDADGNPEAEYSWTPSYIWKLVDVSDLGARNDLKDAIALANTTVKAREGVGEGLFMKSEDDVQALTDAIAAAQAVADNADATQEQCTAATNALADAMDTYANAGNKPEPGMAYYIKQKASGLYLALNAEDNTVVLSEEPVELTWEPAQDGGWYLTDGTSYVGLAGNNTWSMSATADNKVSIHPSGSPSLGTIYYTLQEANGLIATDDVTAGSKCYADKTLSAAADRAYWAIVKNDPREILANLAATLRASIGDTGGLFQHRTEDAEELLTILDAADQMVADQSVDRETLKQSIEILQMLAESWEELPVEQPKEGQAYTIQLNGTDLYLSIATAATVEEVPTRFLFIPADNGRFYLKDETDDLYLGMAPTREGDWWSMGNAPDKKITFGFEYTDGAYHITTQNDAPRNYIGMDETTAGSKCYSDKAKGTSTWLIAEAPAKQDDAISSITAPHSADKDIFDLTGRRVSKTQRGVYIIGGKKVAVK